MDAVAGAPLLSISIVICFSVKINGEKLTLKDLFKNGSRTRLIYNISIRIT